MANNLKSLRQQAGLTQHQLAERASITQAKISAYESAEALDNVTIGNIRRLANALGVSVDDIVGVNDNSERA